MKKGMLFVCVGLLSVAILKADSEAEQVAKSARIVQYTVTIYREEGCDTDRWDAVMDHALQAVKRSGSDDGQAIMDSIAETAKHIYRAENEDGIHGEISVAFGDGECVTGVCAAECRCKDKYRGVCPCGLGNTRACTTVSEDTRSGCCCTRKAECGKGKCDAQCTAPCSRDEKAE